MLWPMPCAVFSISPCFDFIPLIRPSPMNPPMAAITVDGEWIPRKPVTAFLTELASSRALATALVINDPMP
ncbi:Uncharacterised protein [Mycobacteroides abscessus subsp. abscessus]|nr:Uncharacterised protein [Mycobacteroides abscessus subsp. abscessus]